jgi:hypothetical protein
MADAMPNLVDRLGETGRFQASFVSFPLREKWRMLWAFLCVE